jgi:hypothetical protein
MIIPIVIDNPHHRIADLLSRSAGTPLDIATAYSALVEEVDLLAEQLGKR